MGQRKQRPADKDAAIAGPCARQPESKVDAIAKDMGNIAAPQR
jgi:hypothetical protein